jgi:hypothetical protein
VADRDGGRAGAGRAPGLADRVVSPEGGVMSFCYSDDRNLQTAAVADVINSEIAYLRAERDRLQGRLDWISGAVAALIDGADRGNDSLAMIYDIAVGDPNRLKGERLP